MSQKVRLKSQTSTNLHPLHAPITEWIGAECPVDFLNVWFPAHWAPIMLQELQRREDEYRRDHSLWFDAPSQASESNKLIEDRAEAIQTRDLHYQMGKMDSEGEIPTITSKPKVDWIDFPVSVEDILEQFTTLKEGILRGVFRQKAAAAWFGCRAEKAQVTVLLHGHLDVYSWFGKIDSMSHSWPKSGIFCKLQVADLEARTFHLHRKFTRARHFWLSLRPDWNLMRTHMYTDWPGIYSYEQLYDRLFANPGRNDRINDTPSRCCYYSPADQNWQQQGSYMAQFLGYEPCQITTTLEVILGKFKASLAEELEEVEAQKASRGKVKRWRTKHGVVQLKEANPANEAVPITVDPTYEEVLRDV